MHRSRMLVQLYIQINPKGNRCLTRSLISTLSPPYPLNSKGIGNKTSPKERSTCLPIFHRLCDFMEKRLKNLLLPFYCSPQKFILERDSMVVWSIIDILQQSLGNTQGVGRGLYISSVRALSEKEQILTTVVENTVQ